MNLESNNSGHENGNILCLTGLELFSLVSVLSDGVPDGLLVPGVKVWTFSTLECSSCSVNLN